MSNNPEFHQCGTCGYEWKHGVHGGHSCTDTLSARLASQQAAHDAEIARLKEEMAEVKMELDCAKHRVCCEIETLRAAGSDLLEKINQNIPVAEIEKAEQVLREALSATQQQVSEWEAKKLEPLRAQVAMLRARVSAYVDHDESCAVFRTLTAKCTCGLVDELSNTQATAEQFIAECEQRGAVKALEEAAGICQQKWEACIKSAAIDPRNQSWPDGYTAYDCAKSIKNKAEDIRATSKKAG